MKFIVCVAFLALAVTVAVAAPADEPKYDDSVFLKLQKSLSDELQRRAMVEHTKMKRELPSGETLKGAESSYFPYFYPAYPFSYYYPYSYYPYAK